MHTTYVTRHIHLGSVFKNYSARSSNHDASHLPFILPEELMIHNVVHEIPTESFEV